jgi:hypothetical protein
LLPRRQLGIINEGDTVTKEVITKFAGIFKGRMPSKFPNDLSCVIFRLCNMINSLAMLKKSQGRKSLEEIVGKIEMVIGKHSLEHMDGHGFRLWLPV